MSGILRRGLFGAAIAVSAALIMSGCAGPSTSTSAKGSAGPSQSAQAFTPTTIKIALPTGVTSFANSDVIVADKMGYFKDLGLTVQFTNLKAGGDSVKGVVSGSFDIGGASIEPVINAYAGGADLQIIASYTDRLPVDLVTPDSIKTVQDLKGKNLGVQEVGSFREVMTRMVLESAGLGPNDVHYVPTDAQAIVSGLIQGKIVSGVLQPEQFVAAKEKDPSLHALVNLHSIQPNYFYGTYFTTKKWLDANPQAAVRFAEALTRAHRLMYDNENEVVPIIAQATGFSDQVIKQAWQTYMVEIQAYPKNVGLDESSLTYTVNEMKKLGTLRSGPVPDMSGLVNREPLTQAVKALGEVPGRTNSSPSPQPTP